MAAGVNLVAMVKTTDGLICFSIFKSKPISYTQFSNNCYVFHLSPTECVFTESTPKQIFLMARILKIQILSEYCMYLFFLYKNNKVNQRNIYSTQQTSSCTDTNPKIRSIVYPLCCWSVNIPTILWILLGQLVHELSKL